MIRCPACSSVAPDGSRYCPSCASPLETPTSAPTETSFEDEQTGERSAADQSFSGKGSRPLFSSSARARFLPGTVIDGRYRVIALLGRGGMGEVYRADDLKLGQPVALKFLPAAVERDRARLDRFLNEVKVALRVTHPNVCRVYDIGEISSARSVPGRHYLSMEYVDGEDLASLLRRIERLPQGKAVQIARQLCAGLAAAHEQGILHRDLKPANVMIDGRGRAKITDFGLASLAEGIEGDDVRAGTPAYMAPEQRRGEEVTARSDIFSLGLVLYELFTGKRAFAADSPAELARIQQDSTPARPSSLVEGLDPAVERVILRCLDKDPSRRPGSSLAVAAALPGGDPLAAALAAGETPSPEMVADAGQTEGLHPALAVLCFVLILIGLVAVPYRFARFSVPGQVTVRQPPEVMTVEARRIIEEAGHEQSALDSIHGYEYDGDYLDSVKNQEPSPTKWDELGTVRPSPIRFWYRQSPRQMLAQDLFEETFVTFEDPPWTISGMAGVRLGTEGRLLAFRFVPPRFDDSGTTLSEPDYSELLRATGLELESLKKAEPAWNPLVACDERVAWEGSYPGRPSVPIRIEAGSYRGCPVYFEVIPPWRAAFRQSESRLPPEAFVLVPIMLTLLVVGILLARRNLRQGRGDRRAAFRLGAYQFMVAEVWWILRADHVSTWLQELNLFLSSIAFGLMFAGFAWLFYLAGEPYARRLWPDVMISWSRLLAGRLRDPLIGRDILLGGLAALVLYHWWSVYGLAARWLNHPTVAPAEPKLDSLIGVRQAAGQFIAPASAVISPFAWLLLLLLVRASVRWLLARFASRMLKIANPAAVAVSVVLVVVPWSLQTDDPLLFGLFLAGGWILWFFLLIRFGVLTTAFMLFFQNQALAHVYAVDPSAWYAGRSYTVLFLLAVLAAYGLYISLAGRPVFAGDLLEAE